MYTIKKIAEMYMTSINDPFNYLQQKEIEAEIAGIYATMLREDFRRNGHNRSLLQFILRDAVTISDEGCGTPGAECGDKVVSNVPIPVDTNIRSPFTYVGDVYKQYPSFEYMSGGDRYFKHLKFNINNNPRFSFTNGTLVIKGNFTQKKILIEGYFANPEDVNNDCVDTINCISSEEPMPITDEMVARVLAYLRGSRNIIGKEPAEINVNKPATK